MLKIIKKKEAKTEIYFTYEFQRKDASGFSFPCDERGVIQKEKLNWYGMVNYEYCIRHPEEFEKEGVVENKYDYVENAIGECPCGRTFELWNQYMGACQCSHCGQWYNLFGEELLPPEQWEEDCDY